MYLLEVPGIGAGLGIDREHRGAEQIVAFAHRAVVIRAAIADGEVNEAELRIERRGVPDRCAAASVMSGAGRPGVAAGFARRRQRVSPPQDLAGLGVERCQAATYAEFATGDASIDDPVEIERRVGDPITIMPVLDGVRHTSLPVLISSATMLASS